MTLDNNNIEVVRAINRNTDELRRITAELKRLGISAKDSGDALATVLRLREPARDVATFGDTPLPSAVQEVKNVW